MFQSIVWPPRTKFRQCPIPSCGMPSPIAPQPGRLVPEPCTSKQQAPPRHTIRRRPLTASWGDRADVSACRNGCRVICAVQNTEWSSAGLFRTDHRSPQAPGLLERPRANESPASGGTPIADAISPPSPSGSQIRARNTYVRTETIWLPIGLVGPGTRAV